VAANNSHNAKLFLRILAEEGEGISIHLDKLLSS